MFRVANSETITSRVGEYRFYNIIFYYERMKSFIIYVTLSNAIHNNPQVNINSRKLLFAFWTLYFILFCCYYYLSTFHYYIKHIATTYNKQWTVYGKRLIEYWVHTIFDSLLYIFVRWCQRLWIIRANCLHVIRFWI